MPSREIPSSVLSSMVDAKQFTLGVGYAKEVRGKNHLCLPTPPPPKSFCPPKCIRPRSVGK